MTANTQAMVFNAAAVVVGLGTLVGIGRMVLVPAIATPCGERNENTMTFRVEQDGAVFTGADILERVGHTSLGVIENLDVVRPRDTRIPAAMRVMLRDGPGATGRLTERKGGVVFPWEPRSIQKQSAACLSYKVFFEGDLDFHNGGTLPGIHGRDQSQQSQDEFVSHVSWREYGLPGVTLSVTAGGITQAVAFESRLTFPRGQWIKIDKEVSLNAPGQANGILRVWIDGMLAIEKTDVIYRSTSNVILSGVGGDVHYGGVHATTWAPSETTIWVSPFEISWR